MKHQLSMLYLERGEKKTKTLTCDSWEGAAGRPKSRNLTLIDMYPPRWITKWCHNAYGKSGTYFGSQPGVERMVARHIHYLDLTLHMKEAQVLIKTTIAPNLCNHSSKQLLKVWWGKHFSINSLWFPNEIWFKKKIGT